MLHSAYIKHTRVTPPPGGPSLTKQAFKGECDINNIMKKYEKNGLLDHLNTHNGDYGNFIGYQDYHSSLNKILEAKEAFLTIPATVRAQFDNDPSLFMSFAQDEKNHDRMVELGLAHPPKASAEGTGPKEGADPPSPPLPLNTPPAPSKDAEGAKKPAQ